MTDENPKRVAAFERAERGFAAHVATYLIVNSMLTGVRAFWGARPVLPVRTMLWWGIGLAYHGWIVRREKPGPDNAIRRQAEQNR